MTTRNFLQHDCQTGKVKIATCGRLKEGLSDLPLEQPPPSATHLLWSKEGNWQPLQGIQTEIAGNELQFHMCSFSTAFVGTIPGPWNSNNC